MFARVNAQLDWQIRRQQLTRIMILSVQNQPNTKCFPFKQKKNAFFDIFKLKLWQKILNAVYMRPFYLRFFII